MFTLGLKETAQLESERTRLSLILDLNNSVVANLKLHDVLQSISPNIRKVMRLDLVSLVLPDKDGQHTRLYALDFPNSKGLVQQDELTPLDGSVAGQVLRSGKSWVGDTDELSKLGFDPQIAIEEGLQTLCILPLNRFASGCNAEHSHKYPFVVGPSGQSPKYASWPSRYVSCFLTRPMGPEHYTGNAVRAASTRK
jgi:hypothetical protein